MIVRLLTRDEITLIWKIDRREIVENIYHLLDEKLILIPDYFDIQGWPPDEAEYFTPILIDCFDRGGTFWGAFEHEQIIGAAILESKFIGTNHDTLQLKFLHVSHAYRKHGLGTRLFHLAVDKAKSVGARNLYISATPSESTVNYYMRLGCVPATQIDPELFALEPEDIHLEYVIT